MKTKTPSRTTGKPAPIRHKGRAPRSTRSTPSPSTKRRVAATERRVLGRVLHRFDQAVEVVRMRGDEVQNALHGLLEAARAGERRKLMTALAEANLLDYLQGLAQVLAAMPGDVMARDVQPYRDVPGTVLDLLREYGGLQPRHAPGERLWLGEPDLAKVRFLSPPERTPPLPVEVVVVASGWEVDGQLLTKPAVQIPESASAAANPR